MHGHMLGFARFQSSIALVLTVVLAGCASRSAAYVDYAETYRLKAVSASIVNAGSGQRIFELQVAPRSDVLVPMLAESRNFTVSPKDDVIVSASVGFGSPGIGSPSVKVIVDDRSSNDVLASKLFENLDLKQNGPDMTLQVAVPHAACRDLRISVRDGYSELFLAGRRNSIVMMHLCDP